MTTSQISAQAASRREGARVKGGPGGGQFGTITKNTNDSLKLNASPAPINPARIAGKYSHEDLDEQYAASKQYLSENQHLDDVPWLISQAEDVEPKFEGMEADARVRLKQAVVGEATMIARKDLKARLPEPVPGWKMVANTVGDHQLEPKFPATKAETRRLLKNTRGEPDNLVRQVVINHEVAPENKVGEHIAIVGPKDGRPILVTLHSGIPQLKVESGKAIIQADSSWGNSVSVAAGAEAIVIAEPGIKITCDVEEGGKLTVMTNSQDNRTFSYGAGEIVTRYAQDDSYPDVTAEEMSEPYNPEDHDQRWEDSKRFLRALPGKHAQKLHDLAIREDNGIGFGRAADVREGQAAVIEKVRELASGL